MLDITSLDGTKAVEDSNAGRIMIEVKVRARDDCEGPFLRAERNACAWGAACVMYSCVGESTMYRSNDRIEGLALIGTSSD